ncbi:MAG: hypothetical protein U5N58_02195 [Actinomycetota bacterium]|nr:hypothetical protein [Actinomycetota bacterium]
MAQFFDHAGYSPCGFVAPIKQDQLHEGVNRLWVFAYDEQGRYNIVPLEINLTSMPANS